LGNQNVAESFEAKIFAGRASSGLAFIYTRRYTKMLALHRASHFHTYPTLKPKELVFATTEGHADEKRSVLLNFPSSRPLASNASSAAKGVENELSQVSNAYKELSFLVAQAHKDESPQGQDARSPVKATRRSSRDEEMDLQDSLRNTKLQGVGVAGERGSTGERGRVVAAAALWEAARIKLADARETLNHDESQTVLIS
jgi:hypothetical protein